MIKDAILINMSDAAAKRQVMTQIGKLTGLYELYLKPRKRTRSLDQNAYYFSGVVTPFRDWLRENYGDEQITTDQAHEMLKVKILGLDEKRIEGTNETIAIIPRSKTLTVEEFSDYIEKCSAWLAEFCSIVVLSPELFYGEEMPRHSK